MARGSKEVKPLFDDEPTDPKQDKSHLAAPITTKKTEKDEKESIPSSLTKYKKQPKYKTHVPHNIRIPKEMRRDLEKIAKKLGIPLGKNTGFFQEFTIDALRPAIEKAKKELGIDD